MRYLTILILTGALMAQAPGPEPWATTSELMTSMVIPSSNALFNAGLDGDVDDAGWEELRNQALILGESANLLVTPGRAPAESTGNADWIAASKEMQDAAQMALKAIEEKDLDALTLDGAEAILNSCSSCHSVYFN